MAQLEPVGRPQTLTCSWALLAACLFRELSFVPVLGPWTCLALRVVADPSSMIRDVCASRDPAFPNVYALQIGAAQPTLPCLI